MKKLFALLAFLPLSLFGANPSMQEATNISASVVGSSAILLNPPHVGVGRTMGRYTAALSSSGVLYSPPNTAGIVRDVFVQADLGVTGNLNTNCLSVYLQIYSDCGSDTNSPAQASFQFNVPLADLLGNRFNTNLVGFNGGYNVNRQSALIDSVDVPSSPILGGEYIKTVHLKTPIPFTNGCFIRLWNAATAAPYSLGYLGGTIENGTLAYLGPYWNWRLRSARFLGPGAGGVSNWLFNVRGPGVLAGVTQAVADSAGSGEALAYIDSHGMVAQTSATTQWTSTGGDDFFLSTYQFSGGPGISAYWGISHIWRGPLGDSQSMNWDAYRWFVTDAPSWTNTTVNVFCDSQNVPQAVSDVWIYYAP